MRTKLAQHFPTAWATGENLDRMPYFAEDLLAATEKPWEGPWSANEIVFGSKRSTSNHLVRAPTLVGKARSWGMAPAAAADDNPIGDAVKVGPSARQLTSQWLGPEAPAVGVSKLRERREAMDASGATPLGPDYLKMNRAAVRVGAITARDQAIYRARNPALRYRKRPQTLLERVRRDRDGEDGDEDNVVNKGKTAREAMAIQPEQDWLKFMFLHEKKRLETRKAKEAFYERVSPKHAIAAATVVGRDRRATHGINDSVARSGVAITSLGSRYRYGKGCHGDVETRVDAPRDYHPGVLPLHPDSSYVRDFSAGAAPSAAAIDGLSTTVPARPHAPARLDAAPTLGSRLDGYRSETAAGKVSRSRQAAEDRAAARADGVTVRFGTVRDTAAGYGGGGAGLGYRFDTDAGLAGAPAADHGLSLAGTVTVKGGGINHAPRWQGTATKGVYREAYTDPVDPSSLPAVSPKRPQTMQ